MDHDANRATSLVAWVACARVSRELSHALGALQALSSSSALESLGLGITEDLANRGARVSVGPSAVTPDHLSPQGSAGRQTGRDVDDCVPETLERKHKGGHVEQRERDLAGMHHRVHTVGRGGDPGDHHSHEEEDGDLGVGPGGAVGIHRGAANLSLTTFAGNLRGNLNHSLTAHRGFGGLFELGLCLWVSRDADGVGIRSPGWLAGAHSLWTRDGSAELLEVNGIRLGISTFRSDRDFGRLHRAEGVSDLRGKGNVRCAGAEVTELSTALVDFAAGTDIDQDGEENDDPGLMC